MEILFTRPIPHNGCENYFERRSIAENTINSYGSDIALIAYYDTDQKIKYLFVHTGHVFSEFKTEAFNIPCAIILESPRFYCEILGRDI